MTGPESVDEAADQLYGVPPGEFVTTRQARAAQARAGGDAAAATATAALRRPTQAGWLVNLLVREQPEQIATLLELGAAMRRAQTRLAAKDLKTLTVQRHKLVRALAGQAHDLAADQARARAQDTARALAETTQAAAAARAQLAVGPGPAAARQTRGRPAP